MALGLDWSKMIDGRKMTFDTRIIELGQRLYTHLSSAFTIISSPHSMEEIRVDTSYGYTMQQKTITYKPHDYEAPFIKWGFEEDEAPWEDWTSSTMDRQMVVADRELMEEAIINTYNNFGPYIDKLIAKILLDGYTVLMNQDENINFIMNIDESCISPKGHSISHILLRPNIVTAIRM